MKQNTDIHDYAFLASCRISAERSMVAYESHVFVNDMRHDFYKFLWWSLKRALTLYFLIVIEL